MTFSLFDVNGNEAFDTLTDINILIYIPICRSPTQTLGPRAISPVIANVHSDLYTGVLAHMDKHT